ncbi:cytochrome P450 [Calocera cornea HHB12733]|uniref:Cytochrome P450 n=1 Tax=Calocera cornea HHB12733 TaxID=1353952 RepID=A0A165EJP1_9BASI|nr:cytochrome P450 [Calocera cornea HHB12733]
MSPITQVLSSTPYRDVAFVAVAVVGLAVYYFFTHLKRKDMPPGPPPAPFVGNRHQLPKAKPWRKFAEWNAEYGPVVSIYLGKTPVIVLGTAQAAWDLLEKRSNIYSSRPRFIMSGEILSENRRGLMMPNNAEWRKWRKVLNTGFHNRAADTYKPIQSLESKRLMWDLLTQPEGFETHLQRYAASVVVSVTYGRRIESLDEWIVKENNAAMEYLTSVNIPGKYAVESFPILLKLPRWMQTFRKEAEERKQKDIELYTHLVNDVKAKMADGTCKPCLAKELVEAGEAKTGLDELALAYACSTPFGAGIETTAGTMLTMILALVHHPEVLRKAQEELDRVIGPDRMPTFEDHDSLPYVRATCNEALRWRPVAVLGGTPHAVTEDDYYEGMFIPAGSTVFANLDGIMRDPVMFPDPDNFLPERFLTTTDPRLKDFDLPFGFGRRICPGRHLASNSIFLLAARIMWGFDIAPVKGEPLPDTWDYTDGFNSKPKPFRCSITPRSEKVKTVIESEWEGAKEALEAWSW